MHRKLKFLSACSTAENFSLLLAGGKAECCGKRRGGLRSPKTKKKKVAPNLHLSLNRPRRRKFNRGKHRGQLGYVTCRRLLPASLHHHSIVEKRTAVREIGPKAVVAILSHRPVLRIGSSSCCYGFDNLIDNIC
ncbi:histidine kinase M7 [Pseudozyma hubeiensis SY62]|uniref:Histidine kinase M7 n=1 Tax=Pseudozyma hubeiensis (strain SY62) TaxID=1305764 RepID=R9P4Y9_PSEHS|nr:histidine kinase M7 [Pseudozyma hubeiensis SY62]GAC96508.1 histidine kinase M7 [Pseudozyma hubeiensis SY62]